MKKVTFNVNIYGHSGIMLFKKGQQVDLWEEEHFSNITGDLIPRRLKTVSVFHNRIVDVYSPKTFKEYGK